MPTWKRLVGVASTAVTLALSGCAQVISGHAVPTNEPETGTVRVQPEEIPGGCVVYDTSQFTTEPVIDISDVSARSNGTEIQVNGFVPRATYGSIHDGFTAGSPPIRMSDRIGTPIRGVGYQLHARATYSLLPGEAPLVIRLHQEFNGTPPGVPPSANGPLDPADLPHMTRAAAYLAFDRQGNLLPEAPQQFQDLMLEENDIDLRILSCEPDVETGSVKLTAAFLTQHSDMNRLYVRNERSERVTAWVEGERSGDVFTIDIPGPSCRKILQAMGSNSTSFAERHLVLDLPCDTIGSGRTGRGHAPVPVL